MGSHRDGRPGSVSVAELVARTAEDGWPLWLNWRPSDLAANGLVAPERRDDRPTGVIPRVADGPADRLPRRPRTAPIAKPDPNKPTWIQHDVHVLEQVLNGLLRLA
ncbi:hypothetical protein Aglo01_31120 [Actinokineospora globicatena]|nr:hypothetical protein Aglo01_31120 [Actinokineospora globicatena]GLW84702.1 hypothetical protein Aglo02_23420 [Actinokineospora globicatena]